MSSIVARAQAQDASASWKKELLDLLSSTESIVAQHTKVFLLPMRLDQFFNQEEDDDPKFSSQVFRLLDDNWPRDQPLETHIGNVDHWTEEDVMADDDQVDFPHLKRLLSKPPKYLQSLVVIIGDECSNSVFDWFPDSIGCEVREDSAFNLQYVGLYNRCCSRNPYGMGNPCGSMEHMLYVSRSIPKVSIDGFKSSRWNDGPPMPAFVHRATDLDLLKCTYEGNVLRLDPNTMFPYLQSFGYDTRGVSWSSDDDRELFRSHRHDTCPPNPRSFWKYFISNTTQHTLQFVKFCDSDIRPAILDAQNDPIRRLFILLCEEVSGLSNLKKLLLRGGNRDGDSPGSSLGSDQMLECFRILGGSKTVKQSLETVNLGDVVLNLACAQEFLSFQNLKNLDIGFYDIQNPGDIAQIHQFLCWYLPRAPSSLKNVSIYNLGPVIKTSIVLHQPSSSYSISNNMSTLPAVERLGSLDLTLDGGSVSAEQVALIQGFLVSHLPLAKNLKHLYICNLPLNKVELVQSIPFDTLRSLALGNSGVFRFQHYFDHVSQHTHCFLVRLSQSSMLQKLTLTEPAIDDHVLGTHICPGIIVLLYKNLRLRELESKHLCSCCLANAMPSIQANKFLFRFKAPSIYQVQGTLSSEILLAKTQLYCFSNRVQHSLDQHSLERGYLGKFLVDCDRTMGPSGIFLAVKGSLLHYLLV